MAEARRPRILVVEDETLIAMLLEDMLDALGYEVEAVASTRAQALALAAERDVDAALLDVNVAGEPVFPVAETLAARGVPMVFCSGYGQAGLPREWADRPCVAKPFGLDELERVLGALFG